MDGAMIISLDFELLWGMRDHVNKNHQYAQNIKNVHIVVPRLLSLFEKYNIHATWATVGMLFAENKNELLKYIPMEKPTYIKNKYSNYLYLDEIGNSESDDPYYFASSLLSKIVQSRNQELGSHTFSHFYCTEKGQNAKQFCQDIEAAVDIANKFPVKLKSIVFPRNQCNDQYIRILRENAFSCYRGCSDGVIYNTQIHHSNSILFKIFRLIDNYTNIFGIKCYPSFDYPENQIVNIKASRFLRTYCKPLFFLETLKMCAIKKQMKYAAKNGMYFHLWWHPHNMGSNIEKNFEQLEQLFKYYALLSEKYEFRSRTMCEVVEELSK